MAVKTKAAIKAEINSLFADNTTGDISANDLRTVTTDIVDSYPEGGAKVYKALLTQTLVTQTSGSTTVGKSYTITNYVAGDDFTGVGASSNANGVTFTATTGAILWANGSTLRNNTDSAPVATVLVNTLSGKPVLSYASKGIYYATLTGEFTANKTFCFINPTPDAASDVICGVFRNSDNQILITTGKKSTTDPLDDTLNSTSITIEVYP